jgi:hypothetical protein
MSAASLALLRCAALRTTQITVTTPDKRIDNPILKLQTLLLCNIPDPLTSRLLRRMLLMMILK